MKAIIITRDRLTYALDCVNWLEDLDLEIHIVDHGTTYPPMLSWLHAYDHTHPGTVWWYHTRHPRALWEAPLPRIVGPEERYIVTDCDIAPHPEDPPHRWFDRMGRLLANHSEVAKVGPALVTHDLPDHNPNKQRIIDWERQLYTRSFLGGSYAPIDTTLAMYRPLLVEPRFRLGPAIRMQEAVRHQPWYEDPSDLPEDLAYYYAHLQPGMSHWADPDVYEGRR